MKINTVNNPKLRKFLSWSFLGNILPILSGLICTPYIIEGAGVERFGILSIAWIVAGYFSLFDLGIGRALTKMISERNSRELFDEIHELVWLSMGALLVLGVIGALVLGILSPWLVQQKLQ